MRSSGQSLDRLLGMTHHLRQVHKADLRVGDWLLVMTLNSVYSIRVIGADHYLVSGGWFDRKGLSPVEMTITGCTWGGSAIKLDVVAVCGLCLEFGNRVVTSPIRKAVVIRGAGEN